MPGCVAEEPRPAASPGPRTEDDRPQCADDAIRVQGRIDRNSRHSMYSRVDLWTDEICEAEAPVADIAELLPSAYTLAELESYACEGAADGWYRFRCPGTGPISEYRAIRTWRRDMGRSEQSAWGAEEWTFDGDGGLVSVEYWEASGTYRSVCCGGRPALGLHAGAWVSRYGCELEEECA